MPVPRLVQAWFQVAVAALRDGDDVPDVGLPPAPPALLLARGSAPASVERLDALDAYLLVRAESGPGADALAANQDALERARTLARERDGVVVDLGVPRVVEPGARTGRAASDWFVFAHDEDAVIDTWGLDRFGLPELHCDQSDDARLPMYDAVLVGVAQRLVEEWPGQDPVGPATITLRDVARGYGDASAGGDDPTLDRGVDVTLVHDAVERRLVVTLHDDPATALFAP
ncbi:hypothetical protein [Solicola sp. PLA-1-18]|uniref:hypothetical protein n=1 Tax=Solicola sp. PLA-1-18 TaxID=3380532 RepID=UPI003B7674A3